MRIAELYRFEYLGQLFNYTSHDIPVNFQGTSYEPHNLKRGGIKSSQDISKSQLKITAELGFEIAELYKQGGNVQAVLLTLTKVDLDQIEDVNYNGDIIYKGKVIGAKWDKISSEIKVTPLIAVLQSRVLRYQFSRVCNHNQYGSQCKLDFDTFKKTTTITAVLDAGYTLNIDPLSDTQFINNSGSLCKVNGAHGTITEQSSGASIKLFRPIPGASVGDEIEIAPSCQQNWRLCRDFFNNLANCFAVVDIPTVNPFGPDGIKPAG